VWVPETRLTPCDLLIFVDEAAETVQASDSAGVSSGLFWECASRSRLCQRAVQVRAMRIEVGFVIR
jgi:hypothetical protein